MQRRVRAQANLAEYAPLFLILLGYAEYGGLPAWAMHGFGVVFMAGRGMVCTFTCMGVLSLMLLDFGV